MSWVGRSLVIVALGFALLVLQATATTLFPMYPFTPNLILPIVIFLGVSPEVHVVRGATVSFLLGYLVDLFSGNLLGLQTFVMVATFMLARGAGLRLFLRGPVFQVVLTFVVGALAGGAVLALRAIFEDPAPFPAGSAWTTGIALAAPALVTALAAPLVFHAVRRVESWVMRGGEEAGAAAQ